MTYPKIRIYQWRRPLRHMALQWVYLASSQGYPSREAAIAGFASRTGYAAEGLRAEYASTHGYQIED